MKVDGERVPSGTKISRNPSQTVSDKKSRKIIPERKTAPLAGRVKMLAKFFEENRSKRAEKAKKMEKQLKNHARRIKMIEEDENEKDKVSKCRFPYSINYRNSSEEKVTKEEESVEVKVEG